MKAGTISSFLKGIFSKWRRFNRLLIVLLCLDTNVCVFLHEIGVSAENISERVKYGYQS